ncbi:radical SAM protein [Flavobacteriales bacterium]|nr:radical SAM protein [Flavobacteriales bacterium]
MNGKLLLIIPPFTQLNTPYPATAYLKGFLDSKGIETDQADLSIELFTAIFNKAFLTEAFEEAQQHKEIKFTAVLKNKELYVRRVEEVISFLQSSSVKVAKQLLAPNYFPKGHRITKINSTIVWEEGDKGIIDKAKHYGTLFVEEIGDFIRANVDEFFSFTRYAEQISSSASSFDELDEFLQTEPTIIEHKLFDLLEEQLEKSQPDLICFTVPFPGNLFATLRCGQFIKQFYPNIKVAMGGGYCNTELRSLQDSRVFDYVDFITLDDGEAPLLKLTEFLKGNIKQEELERTFLLKEKVVVYQNKIPNTIFHHSKLPAPNYTGLPFPKYTSFLDVVNPMHRMWTDDKWNKLTISHGCYWKQCSFCDVTLDYIGNYQNTTAEDLVNKMETIISQTGIQGFHFVDEAAPPKMLRALSLKLIERKLNIPWWTNIRFEKTFDDELCELMAKAGCIAVTGGLEVASDRLLEKMKKGVDIGQVARVGINFANHGIMVHAYLMYGFPTQTEQETIDSLEVVRQLFEANCIQSAFWHQFTTTIHSPIGQNPEEFEIEITGPEFEGFAQNDLTHIDPTGAEHTKYTKGLNLALDNYLNGVGMELELQTWFDFSVSKCSHNKGMINEYLLNSVN